MSINLMSPDDPLPLPASLGGHEGRFSWQGHDIWYSEQGSGPPLLLVHAPLLGGSSLEWLANIKALARGHTTYALDLLGFGQSDKPLLHYTGELYSRLLRDFQKDVIGQPADALACGNAGAFTIGAAAEDPDAFVRLALVCPTGLSPMPRFPGRQDPALYLRMIGPRGNALYERLASPPGLLYQLQNHLYYDQGLVTPALVEQYHAAAHQGPGRRYAPAAWASGQLDWDIRAVYRNVTQPLLIIWGEHSALNPAANMVDFLAQNPAATGRVFGNTRLLPHVEQSERFNQLASDFFLARG